MGVVDLAVGAQLHQHAQPLEAHEELVDEEDLQEDEPDQEQLICQ